MGKLTINELKMKIGSRFLAFSVKAQRNVQVGVKNATDLEAKKMDKFILNLRFTFLRWGRFTHDTKYCEKNWRFQSEKYILIHFAFEIKLLHTKVNVSCSSVS